MNTESQFVPLHGFEGIYEINRLGQIKRIKKAFGAKVGRILKAPLGNGYPQVSLRKNGRYFKKYVHRLVLEQFIPQTGVIANHINGDKTDHRLCNLEWATHQANLLHACRTLGKRRGENHWSTSLSEAEIKYMFSLHSHGMNHQQLADHFGLKRPSVTRILNGISWAHLGYIATYRRYASCGSSSKKGIRC